MSSADRQPLNELGYHPDEHGGTIDSENGSLPYAIDGTGETRVLAALPPRGDLMRAPRFQEAFAVIPDSKLMPTKRPAGVPILNQGSTSSCVGHGSTGGVMSARVRSGGKPVTLAPFFVYAYICGGRDAGANLGDAVQALQAHGTSLQSQVPSMVLNSARLPAEAVQAAAANKLEDVWATPTRGEIKTALTLNYDVMFAMYVGGAFMSGRLDSRGVAPLINWPNFPNHCMYMSWLEKLADGTWAYGNNNSWGTSWGNNGTCLLVDGHLPTDGRIEAYAFKSVAVNPAYDDVPPAPVLA